MVGAGAWLVGLGVLTSISSPVASPTSSTPTAHRPRRDNRDLSVTGEPFFPSDQEFIDAFDYAGDPPKVIIDLS